METESLRPQIVEAQKALAIALDDACVADVEEVDTGELIRIEESLAVASKAAKDVISLRLLRRNRRARAKGEAETTNESPAATRRIFEDVRGKRWQVFAVHPSTATVELGALPEVFRQGWLTFESGDSVRRVAPIPDNWKDLSTDDLRLLCHKAGTTPTRLYAIAASRDEKPASEL